MVLLRYSTTASAVSWPNALVARLLSCWLWLPGGVNPPPDCSAPNTPVPQTARGHDDQRGEQHQPPTV